MTAAVEEVRAAEAAAMQGRKASVLLETPLSATMFTGYTKQYLPVLVSAPGTRPATLWRSRWCLGRETVQGGDRLIILIVATPLFMHNVGGDACIGPRADAGIRPCKPGMPPCRKRDCIHSAGKSLDFTEFFLLLLPALLQKVWILVNFNRSGCTR